MRSPLLVALLVAVLTLWMAPARAQVVSEIPRSPAWNSTAQKPGDDYGWIPGHWQWNGARYAWIQGHYAKRPFEGAHWVEGFWQRVPDGWRYVDGYWDNVTPTERHAV